MGLRSALTEAVQLGFIDSFFSTDRKTLSGHRSSYSWARGTWTLQPKVYQSDEDAQKVCWNCEDSVAKEFIVFSQTETINSSQSWDHTELELSGSWFCNLGDYEESPPFLL